MIDRSRASRSSRGSCARRGSTWTLLAQSESLFALSNGHIGVRGNLDEGEPHGLPGHLPQLVLRAAPAAVRRGRVRLPESGQTIVNVTNGKVDAAAGRRRAVRHAVRRAASPRAGARPAGRAAAPQGRVASPAGQAVRLRSTRLVSFAQRSIVGDPLRGRGGRRAGPRRRAVRAGRQRADCRRQSRRSAGRGRARGPAGGEEHAVTSTRALLLHRTEASGLRMAAGMDHVVEAPGRYGVELEVDPDWARTDRRLPAATRASAAHGQVRGVRLVQPALAARAARPGRRRAVAATLRRLGRPGRTSSGSTSTTSGTAPTSRSTGTPRCSRPSGSRCSTSLQAGARAERRAIPAKGLTGPGYDGHAFWDTEMLRAAGAHVHRAAGRGATRCAGGTRPSTWPGSGPQTLGLRGAAFPWRTIRGQECSGVLAGRHRGLPHQRRHRGGGDAATSQATGDDGVRARHRRSDPGRDRAAVAARSATTTSDGRFHIDGVTGPDEYSAVVDDNVYTNLMAARNLAAAADAAERCPEAAGALGVDDEEIAAWRDAADAVRVPYDDELGVHQQAEGFTDSRAGTSSAATREQLPAAAALPRTSTSTASRSSSRPTWCSPCTGAATPSRRGEGPQLRLLRGAHRARLVAVRLHPGGDRRRGRPPRAGRTTTSARPR